MTCLLYITHVIMVIRYDDTPCHHTVSDWTQVCGMTEISSNDAFRRASKGEYLRANFA